MRRAATCLVVISVWLSGFSALAQSVTPGEELNQAVEYLLDFVAHSDCAFIRNGKSHNARAAAEHMKAKYEYYKKEIKTPEDFIRLAASQSTVSRKPYLVETKDGKRIPSAVWLHEALDEYRKSRRISHG